MRYVSNSKRDVMFNMTLGYAVSDGASEGGVTSRLVPSFC